jgi:sugar fermentation stimulation protein A
MILENLEEAIFIKRYKRFLVDVERRDGSVFTVHCPNTGSMRGCLTPGNAVMISKAENLKRKYSHTLEMIQVDGFWVGINTMYTNHLVREALEIGIISEVGRVDSIQPEIRLESGKSRLDFLLIRDDQKIYVEVKNCTLVEDGLAQFPDAVTTRGQKHLEELLTLVQAGHRGIIFFCVQRGDGAAFSTARHIDPVYAETLARVVAEGVEVMAYRAVVTPSEIRITQPLAVEGIFA